MRLVKQTRLVFTSGRSDKVYEIDLCEVGTDRFVVNFRYGKRGAVLKDGSRTVAPVARGEAERTFDKLVRSKLEAGYIEEGREEGRAPAARPAPAPRPTQPSRAPGSVPVGQDPRAQRILERLAATSTDRRWFRAGSTASSWPLERAIWRAGELALREAEPLLIALIGTARSAEVEGGGKGMRDYCIAWALGRCGGEPAARALTALYGNRQTPDHVRRIAAEALLLLGDPASNEEFKAHREGQLPGALRQAARTGKPEVFAAALDEFPLDQHADVLHQLYLVDNATTRPALLDALGKAPLRAPLFQPLRYIFKAAELRRDARVFGILGYRFETTAANQTGYRNRHEAYGSATRLYLRRRIWRVLRRLGQAGDPDYVKLATGVLLPFSDADAVEPRQTTRRRGRAIGEAESRGVGTPTALPAGRGSSPVGSIGEAESRGVGTPTALPAGRGSSPVGSIGEAESRGVGTPTALPAGRGSSPVGSIGEAESRGVGTPTALPAGRGSSPVGSIEWDRFAPYLAFNHILYGGSRRYELARNNRAWRMKPPHRPGGAAPPEREEAFPALWEGNPAALMQLCAQSECTPVHEFAGKALLACPAFLDELDLDDVVLLLGRPYDPTARVGFVVAQRRHDASRPNLPLLGALAGCVHAPGRAQAFTWIDEQRARVLGDSALLAALAIARPPDTRAFARRLLRSSTLTAEVGQALVGRLVAALLALPEAENEAETENERAGDAVQTMLTALASHLATVSVTVIRDLLGHKLAGVQELGAELLLRHDSRSGLIPADLILAVLHSPHDNVRAVGMRLVGELPEAALATMDQLLVRLCTDANADVRNAARPLVKRVAAGYPATRDKIIAGLIEALLRRLLAEDVPRYVLRVLVEDLIGGLRKVDKGTILRLLASGSPHAQELGGNLLAANLPPDALDLDQVIALASHEILSVRRAAWSMYEHSVARVQADMASAVRILDARWRDSREWAFGFFRGAAFGRTQFTADVLVGVIDSVRDDVQAYGRELLQRHFDDADGPALLHRLSEHPSRAVQLFATNYLERFAAGRPDRLEPLMPYFASVLSRVNQGRIAKQRVLGFLVASGSHDVASANIVVPLLFRLAATISVEYRASAIEAMMAIHRARPEVPLPIRVKPVPVRPARVPAAAGGARQGAR